MGVRFAREYSDIIDDLTQALEGVERCYELLDLSGDEWEMMAGVERSDCMRTLADDVIYGLGSGAPLRIGRGFVRHDRSRHVITVYRGDNVVGIVFLI